jgi:hypothetical protein
MVLAVNAASARRARNRYAPFPKSAPVASNRPSLPRNAKHGPYDGCARQRPRSPSKQDSNRPLLGTLTTCIPALYARLGLAEKFKRVLGRKRKPCKKDRESRSRSYPATHLSNPEPPTLGSHRKTLTSASICFPLRIFFRDCRAYCSVMR